MNKLTKQEALQFARDLTITAMERSMIQVSPNATETANNVLSFFKTLSESLASDSE